LFTFRASGPIVLCNAFQTSSKLGVLYKSWQCNTELVLSSPLVLNSSLYRKIYCCVYGINKVFPCRIKQPSKMVVCCFRLDNTFSCLSQTSAFIFFFSNSNETIKCSRNHSKLSPVSEQVSLCICQTKKYRQNCRLILRCRRFVSFWEVYFGSYKIFCKVLIE
jgi:hypothetical protein